MDKPDARTACWLFNFLGAKIESGGSYFHALGACSHTQFDEVQGLALSHCFELQKKDENTFPISVIGPGGVLVDKELGDSPEDLMELTAEWLEMILKPFTKGSGSNSQKSQPPTSNQQNT
jgi:hypothetical protein